MTTLVHGTTIETFQKRGHLEHRVCAPGGGLCRYTKDEYQANIFANLYEELFIYR